MVAAFAIRTVAGRRSRAPPGGRGRVVRALLFALLRATSLPVALALLVPLGACFIVTMATTNRRLETLGPGICAARDVAAHHPVPRRLPALRPGLGVGSPIDWAKRRARRRRRAAGAGSFISGRAVLRHAPPAVAAVSAATQARTAARGGGGRAGALRPRGRPARPGGGRQAMTPGCRSRQVRGVAAYLACGHPPNHPSPARARRGAPSPRRRRHLRRGPDPQLTGPLEVFSRAERRCATKDARASRSIRSRCGAPRRPGGDVVGHRAGGPPLAHHHHPSHTDRPRGIGTNAALADRELIAGLRRQSPPSNGWRRCAPERSCSPRSACSTGAARPRTGLVRRHAREYPRVEVVLDPIYVRDGGSTPRPESPPASISRSRWWRRTGDGRWRSASRASWWCSSTGRAASRSSAATCDAAAAPRPIRELSGGRRRPRRRPYGSGVRPRARDPRNFARAFRRETGPRRRSSWRWPASSKPAGGSRRHRSPRRRSRPVRVRHHRDDARAFLRDLGIAPAEYRRASSLRRRTTAATAAHDDPRRVAWPAPQRALGRRPRQLILSLSHRGETHETSFDSRHHRSCWRSRRRLSSSSRLRRRERPGRPRKRRRSRRRQRPGAPAGGQTTVGSEDLERRTRARATAPPTPRRRPVRGGPRALRDPERLLAGGAGAPADPSIFAVHERRHTPSPSRSAARTSSPTGARRLRQAIAESGIGRQATDGGDPRLPRRRATRLRRPR